MTNEPCCQAGPGLPVRVPVPRFRRTRDVFRVAAGGDAAACDMAAALTGIRAVPKPLAADDELRPVIRSAAAIMNKIFSANELR